MEYLIGVAFTAALIVLAKTVGFEKDRSFYPTILIVIALLYVLFAALDKRIEVIGIEIVIASLFIVSAILGFKKNFLFVSVGIFFHGLFDFAHHLLLENQGVPNWWAGFCAIIDVLLGIYLIFVKERL